MPQAEVTHFSSFPKSCSPCWHYWCYLSADGPDSWQKMWCLFSPALESRESIPAFG